ncbi:MAG: hypothetical protein AMXMBFR33_56210 [Candidatus Xenobia bacterium]
MTVSSITWTQGTAGCAVTIRPRQRGRTARQLDRLLVNAQGIVTYSPFGVVVENLDYHLSLALVRRLEALLGATATKPNGAGLTTARPCQDALRQLDRPAPPARARARHRSGHCWAARRAGAGSGIVPGPAHVSPWVGGLQPGRWLDREGA